MFAAVILLIALLAVPAFADPPTKPAPAEGPKRPPAKVEEDAKLDRNLLKRLDGDKAGPSSAATDLLDRTIEEMRTAAGQIEKQQTGPPTRKLQEEILKHLDELIAQAKQPPPPSNSPPSPGQPDQPPMGGSQQPQPQQQQQPQPESSDPMPMSEPQPTASQQKERGPAKEQAQDSADREPDEAARRKAELARREQMIKDVWGHLPPSVRDRLLNIQSDTILPGYEDIARRYFEALAEDGQSK